VNCWEPGSELLECTITSTKGVRMSTLWLTQILERSTRWMWILLAGDAKHAVNGSTSGHRKNVAVAKN